MHASILSGENATQAGAEIPLWQSRHGLPSNGFWDLLRQHFFDPTMVHGLALDGWSPAA